MPKKTHPKTLRSLLRIYGLLDARVIPLGCLLLIPSPLHTVPLLYLAAEADGFKRAFISKQMQISLQLAFIYRVLFLPPTNVLDNCGHSQWYKV